ncbi:ABC transporter permease [Mycoplasma sp. OR1901]|uniref:ABC transporter permease n=1 Tax=Mycoplasma sp. OR1901 TaxID=2742195 RepID=UPI001583DF93|nr:ABC transporter permease [Mycoplasma sp. OR1901]QKT05127.1 ABC transporter permease [Mycoplasma sp. OR1901]
MTNTKNYIQFLHKLILKKKNTIIIPAILTTLMLIVTIVFSQINLNIDAKNIVFYVVVSIQLIFTLFFASLKSINLFKDLSEDGLELLTFSKPLSRKSIILGKTFVNMIVGLYWAIILTVLNLIFIGVLNPQWLLQSFYVTLLTIYLAYILFGNLSLLIAYKFNTKIALTLPIVLFSPLAFGGTLISGKTTSVSDNFAYFLNYKHDKNPSGNLVNSEMFYLKNGKDNFYLMANGLKNKTFRADQKQYIQEAYKHSKNAPKTWQLYSLLVTPYQMLDMFNYDNTNIFKLFRGNTINNLEGYFNYDDSESFLHNYELKSVSDLPMYEYHTFNEDGSQNNEVLKSFIVPGALKNESHIKGLENTNIIYARDKADSFKFKFPEDQYVYSAADNLVGEIKWEYLDELLSDDIFNDYASKFYNSFINNNKNLKEKLDIKNTLIQQIEKELNDDNSEINRLESESIVLNPRSLQNKDIQNITDKKVYIASSLLYYAYFNFMNTSNQKIIDSILSNNFEELKYTPSQISVRIGEFKYNIGGYSQYTPKQEVNDENKIIIRYELTKSDNYLFQATDEVYELSRTQKVVNKDLYLLIWIAIIAILVSVNSVLYYKKDYK